MAAGFLSPFPGLKRNYFLHEEGHCVWHIILELQYSITRLIQMGTISPILEFVYKSQKFAVVLTPAAMLKWRCKQRIIPYLHI